MLERSWLDGALTKQEVTEKFADASDRVPEVPEEVEDGIHVAPIPRKASDGNLS